MTEHATPVDSLRPDGPGRIAAGQRVTCLPGSLPAREGGRGGGVLVSIGKKTSVVDVCGGTRRRIPNALVHPEAGPHIAAERAARGLRTANPDGRGWLPGWSWLSWTIAEHVQYQHGTRQLPTPPPAPQRLIIVACGARKATCVEAPAGEMYIGSYHRASRRAADAIATPGDRVMILSAFYGLLDPADRILRYEMRLGHRWAITAQGLREQAEQRGVLDTAQVIVFAPAAYAAIVVQVWPHAQLVLAGTRGIGDQMARFAALAAGRTTVADLATSESGATAPLASPGAYVGGQHAVSVRGGLVHLAKVTSSDVAPAPACRFGRQGCRWRLTQAEITCTRCTAIVLRRRALHRWCVMVNGLALAATRTPPPGSRAAPASGPPGRSGLATRRPAARRREPHSRYDTGRRPGDPRRCHDSGRWRHVPARPYRAIPLGWTAAPSSRDKPRRAWPLGPRPAIGRAPPRAPGADRQPNRVLGSLVFGRGTGRSPLTPAATLTRDNGATRSGSANGLAQPSHRITRRVAAGHPLTEPLRPAGTPRRTQASTNGPTQAAPDRCWRTARGLDRTLEVRPMTDLTTRPTEPGTPSPALGPVPVNGTAVGDRRTLRQVSRAEQDRLSADAEVERRARAARLDLELREQRQAAARRQRQAAEQDRQAHVEQRRARRAARHARLRAAAPRWADRALFVLPILFPMAVAWVGQIRFAMTVMHWPLPAAIVFAAGFELSTAYAARLDWLSRAAGDSALLFRGATWGFASGAAIMNYWHAAGPDFAPTGEAVSYGLMSITGVVLWELLSTYRHRTALRAKGKLPAARPRHGLARWVWFRPLTRLASLLALRDGYTTTDLAWQAALAAVDQYGSARKARKAVRAGRPVPRPGVLGDDEQNTRRDNGSGERDRGEGGRGRDVPGYQTEKEITCQHRERDKQVRDNNPLDIESRCKDRDIVRRYPKRDTVNPVEQRDSVGTTAVSDDYDRDDLPEPVNLKADREPTTGERRDLRDGMDDHDGATTNRDDDPGRHNPVTKEHGPHVDDELADHEKGRADGSSGGGEDRVAPPRTSKGAVIATMNTYARERIAQGISVTGADLDRHFGTRDYGRKVLRQLAAEARPDA